MITGEEVVRKKYASRKSLDWSSYKTGWYDREKFERNESMSMMLAEIEIKSEKIKSYIRQLYQDFDIDNADKYMAHNDPFSNCLCLLNHIYSCSAEMADTRSAAQFLLF